MRYKNDTQIILGHNQSYWSWEYDTHIVEADLLMDISNFKLTLDFNNIHIKTGLGAGIRTIHICTYDVGTFFKPQLSFISKLLSRHKQTDNPFPRKGWNTEYSKYLKLGEVFKELKEKENIIVRSIKLNKLKKLI